MSPLKISSVVLAASLLLSHTASAIAVSPPDNAIACAGENGHCDTHGRATVWYGAQGRFASRTVDNGVDCNNATFGDPIGGVVKSCSYRPLGLGTVLSAPETVQVVVNGTTVAVDWVGSQAERLRKSTVARCPDEYRNMGLTCYRGPSTYAKGCTTIFKKYSCRSGYTDNGCFCGRGASSLGMSSMTCPRGWSLDSGRCLPPMR